MCAAMSRSTLSALVAVHEPALRDEIGSELAADGFDVHCAAGLAGCLAWLSSHRVDVLVLADLVLCSDLRAGAAAGTPIMLVMDGGAEDRVRGLESGADDCLTRPIAARELAARLRVIARRLDGGRRAEGGRARSYADIRLDREARRAWRGERDLELTATEFALLDVLVARAERVVRRSEIHTGVWGYDFGASSNSLGVYVGYLRRKLEEPGRPRLLHTIRGFGYVLRED